MQSDTPTPDHIAAVYMNTLSLKSDPASWWAHTEIKRLRAELAAAIKQRDGYRSALERIANEDYRGNRSKESQIAFDALAAADAARAAMRRGATDGK